MSMLKSVRDTCLVVRISVSVWDPLRREEIAENVVKQQVNGHGNTGRYHKHLIDPDHLGEVKVAESRLRQFHRQASLPWQDGGFRIVPILFWPSWRDQYAVLRENFDQAVKRFLTNFKDYRAEARMLLGELYRDEDYPTLEELSGRFKVLRSVAEIPDVPDPRVGGFTEEDRAELAREAESVALQSLEESQRDLWRRAGAVLARISDTLGKPGKRFKHSMISEARLVCDQLRRLNILEDKDLEQVANTLTPVLFPDAQESPEAVAEGYRSDPERRAEAARKVQETREQVADILKKFGVTP